VRKRERAIRRRLFQAAALLFAAVSLGACTVDLTSRDPWPCAGDEDCDELHVCLRTAAGRFCQSPLPRCSGDNCGVRDPGITFDTGVTDPDAAIERDASPPDLGALEDASVVVDLAPQPEDMAPDAASPPPLDRCPTSAADTDALPSFSSGHLCLEELPHCIYEFASQEPASCASLCALLGLPCVAAGYNPTLFWCLGIDPAIQVNCEDTDVRGLVCVCEVR